MSICINPFLVGGGGDWSVLNKLKVTVHTTDIGYSAGYVYTDAFNAAIPFSSLSYSARQQNANSSSKSWALTVEGLNESNTWDVLDSQSTTISGNGSKTLTGTVSSAGKYSQFRMYSIDGARFDKQDSYVELTK